MTKKSSFLPALKSKGFFKDTNSVHAIGAEYVDDRDKYRMHAPERAFLQASKGGPKWNLQKTSDGNLFSKSVR